MRRSHLSGAERWRARACNLSRRTTAGSDPRAQASRLGTASWTWQRATGRHLSTRRRRRTRPVSKCVSVLSSRSAAPHVVRAWSRPPWLRRLAMPPGARRTIVLHRLGRGFPDHRLRPAVRRAHVVAFEALPTKPAHGAQQARGDRKSTRLNSSHANISYAV